MQVLERLDRNNKSYTETENEFFKHVVIICDEFKVSNLEMARALTPILKRSVRAIEQKISNTRIAAQRENPNSSISSPVNKTLRPTISPSFQKESFGDFTSTRGKDTEITSIQKPKETISSIPFTTKDIGRKVKVKVKDIKPYGAFCINEEGKVGLIVKPFISNRFVENVHDFLQIGDEFYAYVIPDREFPGKVLLNAKMIGSILPINERNGM